MKNFKRSKSKTSKANTSKSKIPNIFKTKALISYFQARQSISVASVECLKSVKNLENEEVQNVQS